MLEVVSKKLSTTTEIAIFHILVTTTVALCCFLLFAFVFHNPPSIQDSLSVTAEEPPSTPTDLQLTVTRGPGTSGRVTVDYQVICFHKMSLNNTAPGKSRDFAHFVSCFLCMSVHSYMSDSFILGTCMYLLFIAL